MLRWLCLTCFCLILAARAQNAGPDIVFNVHPAGTRVADQFGPLGTVDRPVRMRPRESYERGNIELTFTAPGYKSVSISVAQAYFQTSKVYPAQGALQLPPASLRAFLETYRWSLLGAGLPLALGLYLAARARRQVRRAEAIEAKIAAPAQADEKNKLTGVIGNYNLVEKLGGGGMATVYRGVDLTNSRADSVAVKVLHESVSTTGEFASRFKREVNLYRQLSHPNIVKMYNWGEQDGLIYLTLELVKGGTLRSRIVPGGMTPLLARHYLEPLFAAVDYAHKQGVVHRDLKPENIMITRNDVVKVADFGLGRSLDSESLTRTDTALGTPAYMAPEQVKGVHFEPASDQYALGVVAYEVLCGSRPFEAAEPVQMIFKHVSEPPRPPRELRPDMPREVEAVLLKMLAKEPQERYAGVAEAGKNLIEALDRW